MSVRRIELPPRSLQPYRRLITDDLYQRIIDLRRGLRGLRVFHLNATPNGGGVSEILRGLIPLMRDLGLEAEWFVMDTADEQLFTVTKRLHNMLQGAQGDLTEFEKRLYLSYIEKLASSIQDLSPDFWIIHDPQPLGISALMDSRSTLVWRSHIDTSHPCEAAMQFVLPFIHKYAWTVFTLPEYVPSGLRQDRVVTFQPAINPLAQKNRPMNPTAAKRIIRRLGIDPARPLVVQVSRFDRWKDPLGVIDAFRLAREEVPGLQLALVGVFSAQDDPEAPLVFAQTDADRRGDPDIHLFRDPVQVGDREVRAFQTAANIVLQKSIREGFGLTVAEAMWKGKPVIGGNAGGIRMQIKDGFNGFLVDSIGGCAQRLVQLLQDEDLREEMGQRARESVRENFLLPRLLYNYLHLFSQERAQSSHFDPASFWDALLEVGQQGEREDPSGLKGQRVR